MHDDDLTQDDHCDLLLEVIEVAEQRGLTFREANQQAFGEWMKEPKPMDSNLMPNVRQPIFPNGTPPTAAKTIDAGWSVETTGDLPPAKGKGKSIDPALFAACCGLGVPPQRIRLDPSKFKPAIVKKIIKAVPGLLSFKAADGFTILHRASTSQHAPAFTPRTMEADREERRPAPLPAPTIDADAVLAALDAACKTPGHTAILMDLPVPGMDTTEGRHQARDAARASGRYTVSAEVRAGYKGKRLIATRTR